MWDRFKGCGAREVLHCKVLRFLGTSVLQGKFTLNMHGRALTTDWCRRNLFCLQQLASDQIAGSLTLLLCYAFGTADKAD